MHYLFVIIVTAFLLSSCRAAPTLDPAPENPAAAAGPLALDPKPIYAEYEDRVTGYGKVSVLFFASSDDPFSRRSDAILLSVYASGAAKVSTYRVNADADDGLKLRFGVFVPNTFVLVDASGERVGSLVHPTESDLRKLLQTGSFPT